MENDQVLAELHRLRQAEETREQSRGQTRRRVTIGLLLAVLALGLLWSTGRMDPMLSGVGLNKNDCIKNGFGATFCGDDAEAYQQQVGQIATGLGAATGSVYEEQASAQANVRASIPAIEVYAADNGGSGYAGMSIAALESIDSGLADIVIASATASSYCVQNTVGTQTYSYQQGGTTGVNGVITPGAC